MVVDYRDRQGAEVAVGRFGRGEAVSGNEHSKPDDPGHDNNVRVDQEPKLGKATNRHTQRCKGSGHATHRIRLISRSREDVAVAMAAAIRRTPAS